MTNVPLIYVGPSPAPAQDQPQPYESATAPYYDLKIVYNLFQANSCTFESPNIYGDMSRINIIYNGINIFGGQIVETKETEAGYEYNCLDYTRLLFGKWPFSKTYVRVSDLIKQTVEYVGMPTSGIQTTPTIWPKLSASNQKRIDTCQQLANHEGWEFHVNIDGIPILQPQPEATEGYIFFTNLSASDYSIDYNDNDIIDGIFVLGKDNVLLYKYYDQSMVVKYGYLEDFISDSNLDTDDVGNAMTQAEALFNTDNEPRYAGTITVQQIVTITEGEWCIFVPPSWSQEKINAFYTKQVTITVNATTCETEIEFLDGTPTPPSEWIYTDPTSGEQVPSFGDAPGDMIYTYRPVYITSDNIYSRGEDQSHINTIIAGLQHYGIRCIDGGIGPNTHDSGLQEGKVPANALLVEIYGGVDAGVIAEKTKSWWKSLLGKRKDALIFMDTAGVLITDLAWLPRAHDDNYDPPSFTGIAHPDIVLEDMGINFREGISPNNLQPVITFLQQEAILTETKAAPKMPASLAGIPSDLAQYNTPIGSIYTWICTNIKYAYYNNSKYSVQQVLALHKGNCDDQAILAITWLTALGYKCQKRHLEVTESDCNFSGGHYDVLVWINNQWVIWDTVCRGLSQIKG